MIPNPSVVICWLRGIRDSLAVGAFISGHQLVTAEDATPDNVHIVECTVCGHRSLSWSWGSVKK